MVDRKIDISNIDPITAFTINSGMDAEAADFLRYSLTGSLYGVPSSYTPTWSVNNGDSAFLAAGSTNNYTGYNFNNTGFTGNNNNTPGFNSGSTGLNAGFNMYNLSVNSTGYFGQTANTGSEKIVMKNEKTGYSYEFTKDGPNGTYTVTYYNSKSEKITRAEFAREAPDDASKALKELENLNKKDNKGDA
ncbi:MAG: hypothetical protein LUB59_06120 [Candidatus Gastranaerophilales bacterium]|nr:hypothetical protein [Candidatus Gastranaerophilales bacterium]